MNLNLDENLLSFIIPARGDCPYLEPCLKAIMMQTWPGIRTEIHLVDNGITTALPTHLPYSSLKEPKRGPQHARNAGLERARGRWVAFVDADTILAPEWLATLMRKMIELRCSGAQGALRTVGADPTTFFARFREMQNHSSDEGLITARFRFPVLNTAACLYDRKLLGDFRFDARFNSAEDAELSWRLFARKEARWVFTHEAYATCYYFPESLWAFWMRNFKVGRAWRMLTSGYDRFYPETTYSEIRSAQNWFKRERARVLTDGPVRAARAVAACFYWIGILQPAPYHATPFLAEEPSQRIVFIDHDAIRFRLRGEL